MKTNNIDSRLDVTCRKRFSISASSERVRGSNLPDRFGDLLILRVNVSQAAFEIKLFVGPRELTGRERRKSLVRALAKSTRVGNCHPGQLWTFTNSLTAPTIFSTDGT